MPRTLVYLVFLCLFNAAACADSNRIDAEFSVLGGSEPVSIDDMINGWDGDYRSGEQAFADVNWEVGYSRSLQFSDNDYGRVRVSRGYRIYYFLKFDKETADFYRAQEQKTALTANKKLDLEVKHFESPVVSFLYTSPSIDFDSYEIKSQFSIGVNMYQPGHRQFGEINGIAYGPDTENFSANIDYRYDQFKLPWLDEEKEFETEKGEGYSLDLALVLEKKDWLLSLKAEDVMARFYFQKSGVTTACLQLEARAGAVCDTNGGNGKSEITSVTETIPVSYSGLLAHKGYDISLHAFQHDRYQRLGLEKGFQTELGRLGVFLYYPQLVGVSWQTSVFNIQFGSDTYNINEAHNIQLTTGVNWQW